jgi:hypothetical protein
MSSVDSFVDCLNERVASGPFKISKKITSSFRDGLISELYKNSGNLTLNNFLDFLKNFSVDLDDKNKERIGDLEKPKDRKWWADVLGMDLKSDINELIVRDYEAIFNPGKKRIMGFPIQSKVSGLKDCLNEEFELKKPRDSPMSNVSSPVYEPEPESIPVREAVEPEPEEDVERRLDPEDGKMYTRIEFIENYGDTEEWEKAKSEKKYSELSLEEKADALRILHDPRTTRSLMGSVNKRKKYKKRKRSSNKSKKKNKKNKKKKKTKRRSKR